MVCPRRVLQPDVNACKWVGLNHPPPWTESGVNLRYDLRLLTSLHYVGAKEPRQVTRKEESRRVKWQTDFTHLKGISRGWFYL